MALAAHLDSRAEGIRALHEPAGSRCLRIGGNLYAAGRIGHRAARFLVDTTYGRHRRRYGNPGYIESNPGLACLITPLAGLYPETLVVHVVRHPADFVRSYIDHGAFSGFKGWAGRTCPYWFLRPEHLEPRTARRWRDMSPAEASAWRWYTINRVIEAQGETLGPRYRRFRFEDLFGDGDGVQELEDWLRMPLSSNRGRQRVVRANASRGTPISSKAGTATSIHSAVREHCGAMMERYGYDPD